MVQAKYLQDTKEQQPLVLVTAQPLVQEPEGQCIDKQESINSFSESGESANRSQVLSVKQLENQMKSEAVEYPPFKLEFQRQATFEDEYGSEIAN